MDVDFGQGQLTIGADGDTKNRTGRIVDVNPKLKVHVLDMKERSRGTSILLFPSPQRGDKDIPAKTFHESLELVRTQVKMPNFNSHLRHYSISLCVMSRVDFMTVATWVGHRDGGVLIGRIYGHLAIEHRQAMGERVVFEPAALPKTLG
jgi:integrase